MFPKPDLIVEPVSPYATPEALLEAAHTAAEAAAKRAVPVPITFRTTLGDGTYTDTVETEGCCGYSKVIVPNNSPWDIDRSVEFKRWCLKHKHARASDTQSALVFEPRGFLGQSLARNSAWAVAFTEALLTGQVYGHPVIDVD